MEIFIYRINYKFNKKYCYMFITGETYKTKFSIKIGFNEDHPMLSQKYMK